MKKYLMIVAAVLVCLSSGSALASGLQCTPEVRKQSYADNTLFGDLLNGISGVGFADEALFPEVKERQLVQIKVVTRYNNRNTGGRSGWSDTMEKGR